MRRSLIILGFVLTLAALAITLLVSYVFTSKESQTMTSSPSITKIGGTAPLIKILSPTDGATYNFRRELIGMGFWYQRVVERDKSARSLLIEHCDPVATSIHPDSCLKC